MHDEAEGERIRTMKTRGSVLALKISEEFGGGKHEKLKAEGYSLRVSQDMVVLEAAGPVGLFYGVQTLVQLARQGPSSAAAVEVKVIQNLFDFGIATPFRFPLVEIMDFPRYSWRGMMLDSSRHFQPKEFVKRYIELLALHKMNKFHWHLTDDQGWRVEIKQYPLLTEKSAWRINEDGSRYGGYYTQVGSSFPSPLASSSSSSSSSIPSLLNCIG
jgi:hexosaminidase